MFGKIFAQMYDGTLATKGPWQALVTFQQLIVLANKHGEVDMTAEAISRRTTLPLDIIESGIKTLLDPDPSSRSEEEEGRRIVPIKAGRNWGWRIVNYGHYRKIRSEEERREYHRDYMAKRRADGNDVNQNVKLLTSGDQCKPIAVSRKQKHKSLEPTARATRLPSDWVPTEDDIAYCKANRQDLDPMLTAEAFRDYWLAAPRGTKLDWSATWRSWVRNEKQRTGGQIGAAKQPRRVAV